MVIRGGTLINMAGTIPVDDPAYRYRMPAIFGHIKGSGNSIKTEIPNLSDVARSLHRPPGEIIHFYGIELGARTHYDPATGWAVVHGAHTDAVLQDLMQHRYLEKFVLCPLCRLPETDYQIKMDVIWHRCRACGGREMVDMSHKLGRYILAQHKKAQEGAPRERMTRRKEKDDDKKKKALKDKKDKKKKDTKEDEAEENGDDEDSIFNKALLAMKDDDVSDNNEDDEDEDSTEMEAGVHDAAAWQLAVDAVRTFMVETPNFSTQQLVDVVTRQQRASALRSPDKVHILVRAALTAQCFKLKEIEKLAPAIISITNGNRIMERHLIAAMEAFSVDKPKHFPVLLKQLYDADALDEETILEWWADEGRSEYTLEAVKEQTRAELRGEAEPVVVWLQDVDSDDDNDDD